MLDRFNCTPSNHMVIHSTVSLQYSVPKICCETCSLSAQTQMMSSAAEMKKWSPSLVDQHNDGTLIRTKVAKPCEEDRHCLAGRLRSTSGSTAIACLRLEIVAHGPQRCDRFFHPIQNAATQSSFLETEAVMTVIVAFSLTMSNRHACLLALQQFIHVHCAMSFDS